MDILRFEESEPSTFPTLITYDEEGIAIEEPIVVSRPLWLKIESHICHRWTARQAVWTVNGPGVWEPHLLPVSNISVDIWDDTNFTWSAVTPDPSPMGGYEFSQCRTYRITATVGATAVPVPQMVIEAYQRLEQYCEDTTLTPAGSSSYSSNLGGALQEEIARSPNWLARAMQASGAADLLRAYRRA